MQTSVLPKKVTHLEVIVTKDPDTNELKVYRPNDEATLHIPRQSIYNFLSQAGLMWSLNDLSDGAGVVGYQTVWDAAQDWQE